MMERFFLCLAAMLTSSAWAETPNLQSYVTSCEAARSTSMDLGTNTMFERFVSVVRESRIDEVKAAGDGLLMPGQYVLSKQQRACAEQVTNLIREQQNAVASQPPNRLKNTYKGYIAMQACFEARKEFRVQYVTKRELDAARSITRRDEQKLLKDYPSLAKQKDALWEEAKKEYGASDFATILRVNGTTHSKAADQYCKIVATAYTADTGYQQQTIKKDF